MWGLELWGREAIPHVLAGSVTMHFAFSHPLVSVLMFAIFVVYQLQEFHQIHDKAFRDIQQYAVGMYAYAIARAVVVAVL